MALLASSLALVAACGSNDGSGFGDGGPGTDASMSTTTDTHDATVGKDAKDTGMTVLTGGDATSQQCVPSTCAALDANCGAVTDTKCGGVVQCGACETGICGGSGVPNQCGSGGSLEGGGGSGDACVKATCASQSVTCGVAGDGCGGMLSCGTCTAPQTCGGATPGQCGCTGTCAEVPTCDAGTTTLSGKVYDPAVNFGLYNALVYVPNDPTDPGLQPFPAGITCDVCGTAAAGDPLVTAYTAPDGTFTLSGVPVGATVPLVIQLGRWRRQFTVDVATPCGANTVPDKTLSMPQNHSQGDLPRIAIVTGDLDPVECVLRKIGVSDSEFGNPGGAGYFQFFTADQSGAAAEGGGGAGTKYSTATPTQDALFATTGGPMNGPLIDNYDITIMECEGYPQAEAAAQETALAAYAGAGGRVFASDFQYTWFNQTGAAFPGVANWGGNHDGIPFSTIGVIDQPPTNPVGTAFQEWLEDVGVSTTGSGTVTIDPAFGNLVSVTLPTQQWLHSVSGSTETPIHLTFNTPIGASAANQCGRVTFSDWHAQNGILSGGTTFPAECPAGALTPQEAILEFMLFDLSACVQPYTPICTSETCASQGIQCGPAGDGCGNALSCGVCPAGQTCGGGGPGKCGSTAICTAETCASQNIQCGPAGDGCGNELQCGSCATGEICGLTTPGQCAMGTK